MGKIGFIGCGNMGGALAIAVSKIVSSENIYLANKTVKKAEDLAEKIGAKVSSNSEVAKECEFIFLGVKPQMMGDMLKEIAPVLKERTDKFFLVTMAAALTIEKIKEMAGGDYPVIRIMPNTPVKVAEGVILYTCDRSVSADETKKFVNLLTEAGLCMEMPEKNIDAASAVSGCGPAFADMFIEALTDGAVACGIPAAQAVMLASQMLLGAAKLCLETKENPGKLRTDVCSPGGTTIQGVRALEEGGFRGTVMDAVIASYEKTLALK